MELKKIKNKLNNNIEKVFTDLGIKYEVFGNNIYSICPVHEGGDNPRGLSFSLDKNIWKCWTRDCQYDHGNDVFGLIHGVLSKSSNSEVAFRDVLNWSCKLLKIKNNIKVIEKAQDEDSDQDMYDKINSIWKKEDYTHDIPSSICDGVNMPSDYFKSRGFKVKTLKYFQVGDCYNSGIMKERAIIPIYNDDGSVIVGNIGRTIKEYRSPKFIIHPKGFNKSHYLYNYHRAIPKAIETKSLFVVEGQGDVWKLYESGVENAVGIFGKTLSQQQINKLFKIPITHLIILMDNDQAGREARIHMQRQLGRMYKLTFPRISAKDIGEMKAKEIQEEILSNLKGTY